MMYNVNMNHYSPTLKAKILKLRTDGKTYSEIKKTINLTIPKSTLSSWCRQISMPRSYTQKINSLNQKNLIRSRKIAWKTNRINHQKYLDQIDKDNLPIAKYIQDKSTALIALSMLCLGEASKSTTKHHSFSLGSSDPRIIVIFLTLLKTFKTYNPRKTRCTVQCRADQNITTLEGYWQKITKIPSCQFYPARKDNRTIGKPTQNPQYHGVLVVDYYDRKVQLTLESLANLVYNLLKNKGP